MRVFGQRNWWRDEHGRVWRIEEMSSVQAGQLIVFLEGHALHFFAQEVRRVAVWEALAGWRADEGVSDLVGLLALGPDDWLARTPLLAALRDRTAGHN